MELAAGRGGDGQFVSRCRDIDRALHWLLGDPDIITEWLFRPNPALYHVAPLAIILGSPDGCTQLRLALIDEAATSGDTIARLARSVLQ
jgi:hypothetical protein